MSESVLLLASARILTPVLWIASLWIYWRGHHLPGGGFIGGLIAVCAFALDLYGRGVEHVSKRRPRGGIAIALAGLAISFLSTLIGPLTGQAFFQGVWTELPWIGPVGSPQLFDLGVYCIVFGMGSALILLLAQAEKGESP